MSYQVIPVAPPHVRPSVSLDGVSRGDDDLTYKYADIVKANNMLMAAKRRGQPDVEIQVGLGSPCCVVLRCAAMAALRCPNCYCVLLPPTLLTSSLSLSPSRLLPPSRRCVTGSIAPSSTSRFPHIIPFTLLPGR